MQIYEPGQDIEVTLPFLDENGDTVEPTALDYQVVDETGASVVALTNIPVFTATDGQHVVTVPIASNTLSVGVVRGLRKVELRMTVGADTYWSRVSYILEVASPLSLLVNSFQSYEEAVLNARGLVGIDGWDAANEQHRKSALQQAYDHMHNFNYRWFYTDDKYETKSVRDLTTTEWGLLIDRQKGDFQKAQIVHANYLLGGNPIEQDIEAGLQSSTIGETSQFYRPRPSLSLSVSRDAMKYLGRWVVWSGYIGRA